MRLDKYLKLTRIIKRRTVAKELLSRQLFELNGKIAKPSSDVKVGDFVVLRLGKMLIEIKVLKICDFCKKEEAQNLYEIIREEIIKDVEIE